MGKLVIELPTNTSRHYVVDDAKFARELVKALDAAAHRVTENPSKQAKVAAQMKVARRIMRERAEVFRQLANA